MFYSCVLPQEAIARLMETETRRLYEPASSFTLQCEEYAKKRDAFMAFLTDAGLKPVKPAGGYFIVVDVSQIGEEQTDTDKQT